VAYEASVTAVRTWGTRGWAWLAVAAVAVLATLAFVEPYGTLNQATYLLDPLHRAMPALFRHDWFVTGTPPYLPAYGWVAAWLFRIDPAGPAAVVAAHIAVTLATYAAIAWLIRAVSHDARVAAAVVAVSAATMGRTLGGNYLLAGYLQPSSIASAGWVVAMAALVRGRYLLCGIALALAGWIHVNFLVLGVGLFTLAALARRDVSRGDLLRLVGPQLVVLAWSFWDLLGATGPSAEAVRILVEFHAPGHYAADRLARHLPELACWLLAAYAALPLLAAEAHLAREVRALWRFALVVFAITAATTAMVALPPLQSLTQVRWSRIAPFGQLACQVIVAAAVVRYAAAPARSLARRAWMAGAIALAILLTGWFQHAAPVITAAATGGVIVVFEVPARFARHAATAMAALIVAVVLWRSPRGAGLTTETDGSPGERAVASWAQHDTPIDAVFLMPPSMDRFRLLSRRAVVVDTKSPPLRPDLLVGWYRRLCAVVGVTEAPTHEWIEQRWTQLAPAEIEAVGRAFGVDYIVVAATTQLTGTRVYANDEYAVYRAAR